MQPASNRAGYTLTELMIGSIITVMAVSAALSGFIYILQGERTNSLQASLDVDVRTAVDSLRHDLRLSSIDKILFYPAGPGPYLAVSFPMATPNSSGMLTYGTNGLIQWDKTVIYHVWSGQPNQLRITTFSPRNNALTDAQRQEQLNSVVTNGNAQSTYDAATAQTRVLFDNLIQWNIYPQQAMFDGYATNTERALNVSLGSLILSSGSHSFKFMAIGKNSRSSGYKIGLDTLVMSPCGVEREAEAQLPAALQSGATAAAAYMPNGGWNGNYRLLFPSTATGQYFTLSMENDRWEETNFRASGAEASNTVVEFDESLSPNDFITRLEGRGPAWHATDQTWDPTGWRSSTNDALRGCAVRVLLRGGDMTNGNFITQNGAAPCFQLFAAQGAWLRVVCAYLAECSSNENYSVNANPTNIVQLYAWPDNTQTSIDINPNSSAWFWTAVPYAIDKSKSYLLSFLVDNSATHADATYWVENHTNAPGSWILPATNSPDAAMTRAANWNSLNPIQTNRLFAVYEMWTYCPTSGTFNSQIVDTHQAAPAYQDINWHADKPWSSTLELRVRTGNNADLSDASAWTNVAAITSPSTISPGSGRYVQFQTFFRPAGLMGTSPKLKDVTLRWAGVKNLVDIGGTFAKGPDHGIWQVTVDGAPLVKGCTMDLTIYRDMGLLRGGTRRLTSTVSMEMYPRNTGK